MTIGIAAQKEKQQRVRLLADVERVLRSLEKRMQFAAVPVRVWLAETAENVPFLGEVLRLLPQTDLETAWETAVRDIHGLTTEDKTALCLLGTQLGKSDVPTQLRCIQETVATVAANKQQAMEIANKARKMCVGLGTCAGMAVALLLM